MNSLKVNWEFHAFQSEKQKKYKHKPQQSQTSMCKSVDPATHFKDAQNMGRDAGNVAR